VEADAYDLLGRTINIRMGGGGMREIRAVRDGVLTGDDLVLTAPLISLFLSGGAMERLVAVPLAPDPDSVAAGVPVDSTMLARPVAEAEAFRLVADSLDVRAPGDVLERIIAVGEARGDSHSRDSLNVELFPPVARTDWLEGDTVVASFEKVLVVDTTTETGTREDYRLSQLEARSGARSLYRMEPSDTTQKAGVAPPAVHCVLGDSILIVLNNGAVDHMDVRGKVDGYHLEPLRPDADSLATDSLALDSLATDSLALDSAAVRDTIRPDTTGLVAPVTPVARLRPRRWRGGPRGVGQAREKLALRVGQARENNCLSGGACSWEMTGGFVTACVTADDPLRRIEPWHRSVKRPTLRHGDLRKAKLPASDPVRREAWLGHVAADLPAPSANRHPALSRRPASPRDLRGAGYRV
jgi:hypothetical protein